MHRFVCPFCKECVQFSLPAHAHAFIHTHPHIHRDRVQPLLKQLAVGAVDHADVLAAARGLACPSALVRGAVLTALPTVPVLASGSCPCDDGAELVGLNGACQSAPASCVPPRCEGFVVGDGCAPFCAMMVARVGQVSCSLFCEHFRGVAMAWWV
jgi:hypothetical protein